MKSLLSLSLVVLFLIIFTKVSFACSPNPNWPPSNEKNYTDTENVFVGVVKDVLQKETTLIIKFKVIKKYKGDDILNTSEIFVNTPSSSAACGYEYDSFKIGDIWNIYASDSLSTTHLNLNEKFNTISEALNNLDKISELRACSEGNLPVCGESISICETCSKEQTYSNICELKNNKKKLIKKGACEECSDEIDPVCGEIKTSIKCEKALCNNTKKITFKNKCIANRESAKNIEEGRCKMEVLVPNGNPTINIKNNQIISSPLIIKGSSDEVWFSIDGILGTVELIADNGRELAKSTLDVKGEWMTEKSVDFESKLEFKINSEKTGKLIFKSTNLSNNPKYDKTFIIPVKFDLTTPIDENEKTGFWKKILNFFINLFK